MNLTSLAVVLRKSQTKTERQLWSRLRAKQMEGLKFRRQQQVGPYIVDFICFEKKVIIELDGGQHMQQSDKDQIRDNWCREQGYKVLRFWDNEIFENFTGVLNCIREKLI
ncbi:MAG: endonuclease domain-containing protein [Candidatus Firestonebacteria bacterium]|nr:endonuclease domain-containing protein [Candidatus Firestonebacteria bacterium]